MVAGEGLRGGVHKAMSEKPENLTVLQSRPTDAELAKGYREALTPLLERIAALMNEADRNGLDVRFSINRDAFGRWCVQPIGIVRVL